MSSWHSHLNPDRKGAPGGSGRAGANDHLHQSSGNDLPRGADKDSSRPTSDVPTDQSRVVPMGTWLRSEPAKPTVYQRRRSGIIVVVVIVGLIALGGIVSMFDDRAELGVGSCVRRTDSAGADKEGEVETVKCSSSHDGRIVAKVATQGACPYSAEFYIEEDDVVFCIDAQG